MKIWGCGHFNLNSECPCSKTVSIGRVKQACWQAASRNWGLNKHTDTAHYNYTPHVFQPETSLVQGVAIKNPGLPEVWRERGGMQAEETTRPDCQVWGVLDESQIIFIVTFLKTTGDKKGTLRGSVAWWRRLCYSSVTWRSIFSVVYRKLGVPCLHLHSDLQICPQQVMGYWIFVPIAVSAVSFVGSWAV